MSKVRQAATLPATMRNPFIAGMMVEQLRARAADLEKQDADHGTNQGALILMVKAFAKELEDFAQGKIGTHADKL